MQMREKVDRNEGQRWEKGVWGQVQDHGRRVDSRGLVPSSW
jgi:hypothetical protein